MELTQWLEREGWQVSEDDTGVLHVKGTPGRLAHEADQLLKDLQDKFGIIFDPAQKTEDNYAASIRAVYDPVTGQATIEIAAL